MGDVLFVWTAAGTRTTLAQRRQSIVWSVFVLTVRPLTSTAFLVTKQCSLMVFGRQTFPVCTGLKVPLTPICFLSHQKIPFCSDHIGEKIIVVPFFPDFLWIFKIRKIRATVVHRRVTRRMGRVGLWRQPGKPFRLKRCWGSEETADQRSQRDCSEEH